MAKAELTQVLDVNYDKFFDAVTRYENYPQFVAGCKKTEVERKAPGHSRVKYTVSMMKDLWYQLDHHEDREKGVITWALIGSDLLKSNKGQWIVKKLGENKVEVKYEIEIEFNISVPGFILNQLVKGSLPPMIKSFATQALKA